MPLLARHSAECHYVSSTELDSSWYVTQWTSKYIYVYLQITCPFLYRVNTVVPLHCGPITSECVALGHDNCISTVPIISHFHYISFSWGKCISGVLTMYITTSDSTDKTESRRRSILVDSDLLICHRDNSEVPPHHLYIESILYPNPLWMSPHGSLLTFEQSDVPISL